MHAPCAHAVEQLGCARQTALEPVVTARGADVAQQLLRRAAGSIHQAQVGRSVPVHERVAHLRYARILLKKMRRAVVGEARLPVGIKVRRIHL